MDYGHHWGVAVGGVAVALTDLDELQQTLDALAKAVALFERIEALRKSDRRYSSHLDKSSEHMRWAINRLAKKAWRYSCQLQQNID